MHCKMFNSIPVSYLLDDSSIPLMWQLLSLQCQMSPMPNVPWFGEGGVKSSTLPFVLQSFVNQFSWRIIHSLVGIYFISIMYFSFFNKYALERAISGLEKCGMQDKQVNSRVSVETRMVGEEVHSVRQGRGETMVSSFKFYLTIQQNILFWRDIYFKVV